MIAGLGILTVGIALFATVPADGGSYVTTYLVGSAFGLAAITALSLAFGADQLGNPAELTDGPEPELLQAA